MMIPTFTTLGSGPTVLMLHGIGGGHLAFAPQVETLASVGYRAVAWDMPGYGHSAPIEPYTFKGLAQSCIDLIDALQCESVVLLGHSMGGMVAQEVVARRPDKVSRLVLAAPRRRSANAPTGAAPRPGRASSSPSAPRRWTPARAWPTWPPAGAADGRPGLAARGRAPGRTLHGPRAGRHLPARAGLPGHLRPPGGAGPHPRAHLLVGGEFDRVAAPAVMKQMASRSRARYTEMAGVGHLMNLEAPDEFDRCCWTFCASARPSAGPTCTEHDTRTRRPTMTTRPVNPVTGLDFTPAVGDMPFTPLQREWLAKAHALGRDKFAARAAQWDREASFPFANYDDCANRASSSSACPRVRRRRAPTSRPT
jgi:3-oxoadipate enol-lactonase